MSNPLVIKLKGVLANARELVGQDKFNEALELLQGMPPSNIPSESPLRYQLLSIKGLASFKAGRLLKAEKLLSRATSSHPQLPLAWKTLSDLYQFAAHGPPSSTTTAAPAARDPPSSVERIEKPLDKLVQVLERFIPLLLSKQKTRRALELSDLLSLSYAHLGRLDRAAQVLADPLRYDLFSVWPRLALLYQQLSDHAQLESLYRAVHHGPGLIDLYWQTGRLAELVATAQSLIAHQTLHWSALESLLLLEHADHPLVAFDDDAARLALLRRLALLWPDRPLAWTYLLPDEEVAAIQESLLHCPAAISQWLRVARLRLQAHQPRYCLSAIRHGVKSILRMSQASLAHASPLACDLVDWQDLPPSAHLQLPASGPLRFHRLLTAFRILEAEVHADLPTLQAILADPATLGYPDLLLAIHRLLARFYLDPAHPHLATARASCAFLLAQLPDDPEGLAGLGWLCHLEGDAQQARAHLQRAVQRAPAQAEYHFQLGQVCLALGDHEAAHRAHLMAARLDATKARYFTALGDHFLTRSHQPHHAIRAFAKAIALDGLDAHAGISLLQLYQSHGLAAEAIQLVESAARRSTQAKWAWIRLGEHQLAAGDLEAALTSFQVALRSNVPTEVCRCLRGLAETYFKQAKHIAALKVFAKILSIEPTDLYSRFSVGLIHYLLGSHAIALKEFQSAHRLVTAPNGLPILSFYIAKSLHRLSCEHQRLGLTQAARELLERSQSTLHAHPFEAAAYHLLQGDVARQLHAPEAALQAYRKYAEQTGYTDHYRIGLVRLLEQAPEAARQEFELALQQHPTYPGWNALALSLPSAAAKQHALLAAGCPAFKSLPHFEEASSRAWNNLGVLYLQHQALPLAQKAFHLAQALHPGVTASAWLGQGLIHLAQREYSAAMAAFHHALETESSWTALIGLAIAAYHLADVTAAYRYSVRGVEAHPPTHPQRHRALLLFHAHLALRAGVSYDQVRQACAVFLSDDGQSPTSHTPSLPRFVLDLLFTDAAPEVPSDLHGQLRLRDWAWLAEVALLATKPRLALGYLHKAAALTDAATPDEAIAMKMFLVALESSLQLANLTLLPRDIPVASPLLGAIEVWSACTEFSASSLAFDGLTSRLRACVTAYPKSLLVLRVCWHIVEHVLTSDPTANIAALVRAFLPDSELDLRDNLLGISVDFPLLFASIALKAVERRLVSPEILATVLARLQTFLLHNPEDVAALHLMAFVYYRYALFTQQSRHLNTALTVVQSVLPLVQDPQERETLWLMVSDCHRLGGAFDRALQAAKSVGKNDVFVLRQVARIMASQGKLENAITLYKKALHEPAASLVRATELASLHSFLWQELAYCYAHLQPPNFAASEFSYRRALAVAGDDAAPAAAIAGLRLTVLYIQWGQSDAALQWLNSVRCVDPISRSLHHFLRAIVTKANPNKQWKTSIERAIHGIPALSPVIHRLFPNQMTKIVEK